MPDKATERRISGLTTLPESAAGRYQKTGVDFGYMPSDAETQRDIATDKRFAPIERAIFMETRRDPDKEMALERSRKGKAASKSTPPGVGMGKGLQNLLEGVKWNLGGREGPGPRDKGYKGSPDISSHLTKYGEDGVNVVGLENVTNEGWKDKADAARHALLAGNISRKTNPAIAKLGMGLYELVSGNPFDEDARMDFHNNAAAAEEMKGAKSYDEVKQKTKEMIDKASYQDFTDKERLVFLK